MNLKFFLLFLMLLTAVVVNSAEVDVHCCIIGKQEDSTIEYPFDEHRITSMIDEASLIFRQVAMRFRVSSYQMITNNALSAIVVTNSAMRSQLYATMTAASGMKLFFVHELRDTNATATWSPFGIIVGLRATGVTLAHELGHACGLEDIYDWFEVTSNVVMTVEGDISPARMPYDCGRYHTVSSQGELVTRLLMYGYEDRTGVDITYGDIDGVWYSGANHHPGENDTNLWHTTQAPVGFVLHGNRHPQSENITDYQ